MVGSTISHYRILERLGEGGMGVVYKARDTRLDRLVAIKVLGPARLADPVRKERFAQEAKSASALNHPNIVTIHDIGSESGIDFIVMEYVDGKTLGELIPRKGMPLRDTLKVSVPVADALAAAHAAGIVHRDLKPANIMVGADGRVRVLDFGLAKLSQAGPESETLTAAGPGGPSTGQGTILGTPGYMSPEQAAGREMDARSDIFSFGSLLYEMVTGKRAFCGDTPMAVLADIIHKDPGPLPHAVPYDLRKLIWRCLRKNAERRFQHMDDVKVALEELNEGGEAGAMAAVPPAANLARRQVPSALAGAAVVVVLLAAGWLWLGRSRPAGPAVPLAAAPLTSYLGNEQTPAISPDGRHVAFSWDGEARDNYDIYVQMIGAGEPLRLTSDSAFDWAPAWSPDGRQILFYRYWSEGRFAVVSVPSLPGREQTLVEMPFPPELPDAVLLFAAPDWSPDGEWVAGPGETGLVLRSRAGIVRSVADLPDSSELFPSFSPDGRSLAFVRQTGGANTDLYLLPLTEQLEPDGEPIQLSSGMRFINRPVWTPGGGEIIFSAQTETGMGLWRIEASGGSPPRRLALAGEDIWFPSISRHGRRLVFEQRIESSSMWRTDLASGGGTAERITYTTRSDALPSYSPDGTRIAFSSNRSGSLEIWVADADGSSPARLTSLEQYSVVPDWSPDGGQIVFQSSGESDSDLYVVGAEGGGLRRLTADPGDELRPSWSPDGEWIYFTSSRSGTNQLWRVPSDGGDAVRVTANGGLFARVSPDGSQLYFSRGSYGSLELWRMPVAGGTADRVNVPPLYDWGLVIAGERLYFTTPLDGGSYPVLSLDLRSGKVGEVARIGYSPFAKFSVSPDNRWLVWDQQEQSDSDLMLVEGFQ